MNITVQQLAGGDEGIYQTADHLVNLIRKYGNDFYVRQWAERILEPVDERDKMGEVRALFRFVKENIRYTRDMIDMEYVQEPGFILEKLERGETVRGDCDDSVVLLLSLLRSVGFMTQVKLTGYASTDYTHVYGEVFIDQEWVPVDTIVKNFAVGDEAPNPTRVKLYPV